MSIGPQLPRRAALTGAIGGTAAFLALRACAARASAGPLFVVCRVHPVAGAGVALVERDGLGLAGPSLPARGHGVCLRPGTAEAVVFARRPGTFAAVFEPHERPGHPPLRHAGGPALLRPRRVRAERSHPVRDRERHHARPGRAGPLRRGRRLSPGRRGARLRHRPARHRPAAGRAHAGRGQWRHPHPARDRAGRCSTSTACSRA